MNASTRRLKVYYGFHGPPYKQHPVIRIAGNYLSKMGFRIGDHVEITMEENRIVISKLLEKQNKA